MLLGTLYTMLGVEAQPFTCRACTLVEISVCAPNLNQKSHLLKWYGAVADIERERTTNKALLCMLPT